MLRAFWVIAAFLLGLVACSPGGAPGGGAPTANFAGYWVLQSGDAFYKLEQSGSDVTGRYFVTSGVEALTFADFVNECGLIGGKVSGRTLTLEVIRTARNCPAFFDVGEELRGTATGQIQGDFFSGTWTYTFVTIVGGVETVQRTGSNPTKWENVPADDPRVQFILD